MLISLSSPRVYVSCAVLKVPIQNENPLMLGKVESLNLIQLGIHRNVLAGVTIGTPKLKN